MEIEQLVFGYGETVEKRAKDLDKSTWRRLAATLLDELAALVGVRLVFADERPSFGEGFSVDFEGRSASDGGGLWLGVRGTLGADVIEKSLLPRSTLRGIANTPQPAESRWPASAESPVPLSR